ncbi:TfuA-like protein [Streptomyces sp. NBC_01754]|uniref:TfuA-like protein n=1 Tax=Streptomyces sp. NBC_01754 TaxID=2975930 RepID=UPI002DDB3AA8|nr:TfuA-like protein [Streptomyces sp. NBC_01754]WSC93443.1 TfuA-like protein [Streptomyces sp. NBC_01754]
MTVHVYSGPTVPADRVREVVPGAVTHPPVRHGDLMRLGAGSGDTVLIIDGFWHQSAPVRHKEILALLADGVAVVGAASMGALRAAELAPYGMVGVGRIFEDFRSGALDADDEVAVLHTDDGRPLSEALVNLRAVLTRAAADGHLDDTEADRLAELARSLSYPSRSWAALGRLAAGDGLGSAFSRADAWRRTHPCDAKREDAERALALLAAGLPPAPGAGAWAGEPWQTSFVRYWQAAFRPVAVACAQPVGFLALLHHQQLYDPGFPDRWRTRVLAAIAHEACGDVCRPVRSSAVQRSALQFAAAAGVEVAGMSGDQLAHWLTEEEVSQLPPEEALVRVVVRSARLDGAWTVWPATMAEAGDLLGSVPLAAEAVAAAFAVNAEIEATDPHHTTAHLNADRIASHLTQRWGLPEECGRAVLDAAARDRAFRDFAGAVEVARTFYLSARTAGTMPSASSAASGTRPSPRT